jgi:hypothetical protein
MIRDFFLHIARDLTSGKGQLRLILQPTMGLIFGISMGLADAKNGELPLAVRLRRHTGSRLALARELFKRVTWPLAIAFVLDCVLQFITLHRVRPVAAVVVALLLVAVPFGIARGFSNRIASRHRGRGAGHPAAHPA